MSRRQPKRCDWCRAVFTADEEVWSEPRAWVDETGWRTAMFYVHTVSCKAMLDPWREERQADVAQAVEQSI